MAGILVMSYARANIWTTRSWGSCGGIFRYQVFYINAVYILPIFSQNRSSEMSNFLALIYDNGELWGKYT